MKLIPEPLPDEPDPEAPEESPPEEFPVWPLIVSVFTGATSLPLPAVAVPDVPVLSALPALPVATGEVSVLPPVLADEDEELLFDPLSEPAMVVPVSVLAPDVSLTDVLPLLPLVLAFPGCPPAGTLKSCGPLL